MKVATIFSRRTMSLVLMALAIGWLTLGAGSALAQPPPFTPPGADHYLVYRVLNPPAITIPVILSDQFTQHVSHQTFTLEYFMTPVNKNNEGMIDDVTHYTWWRISPVPFGAKVLVDNQFGPAQGLNVYQPRYLLNPALKNALQGVPLPFKNHFKVYDAIGGAPARFVSLQDQFGPLQAFVDSAKYLANPVEKIFNGQIFPILDPVDHLVIYRIPPVPAPPLPGPVVVRDEFGTWQLQLGERLYLCVPSYKTVVTDVKTKTWGGLKAMYR